MLELKRRGYVHKAGPYVYYSECTMLFARCISHNVIASIMKKIVTITAAVLISLFVCGQTQTAREIAPGVFYYFGDETRRKPANCTWIVFNEFILVVDANYPWGAEEILNEIRKSSSKPVRFVFNTHYHHDHSFGNDVFARHGAIIVSTTATAEEMRTSGQKEWDHRSDYSGGNMDHYARRFPELTFDDTMIFDDGSQKVELIRMGPAHTWGDGIAFIPKEKILITGDLFVHGNPWSNNVADEHADYERWLLVLDTLIALNPSIIIPGHGEPATVVELRHQREYLADLFQQVRQGISKGKTKQQLLDTIDLARHPVYGSNKVAIRRSIGELYDRMSQNK
jgi:cyclase